MPLEANHSENFGLPFSSRLTATLNLCPIYFKITQALSKLLKHMHNKFQINQTKIKGSCLSGRKVATHDSMSDLPLIHTTTIHAQVLIILLQKNLENFEKNFASMTFNERCFQPRLQVFWQSMRSRF